MLKRFSFWSIAVAALAVLLLFPGAARADESGAFAEALGGGVALLLLMAFGKGVLTSLTPCVYPMIPITVAVFGAKEKQSKVRSFLLALCYVEGMALFYTAIGTPFALAGKFSGALLANPWVVVPIACVMVLLGLSFLGVFDFNLPGSWQAKLSAVGGRGYGGAFLMGLVAGPIAAPCTGPFLVDMVAHVAATGDPLLGAAVLFTYAHGIGVLFFFLALSSSALPKSGEWLDTIKTFCAVLLFVGAFYFLRPIVPQLAGLADPRLWFVFTCLLLAAVGATVGVLPLRFWGSWGEKLRRVAGVLMMTAGLIGTVNWYFIPKRDVGWRHDEQAAFVEARENKLHVLIDFGAQWCAPCKEIEKIMAEDEVLGELNQSFVLLKFDVTEQDDADEALQKRFKAQELPAVLFLDASGNELARYNNKAPGKDTFVNTLRGVVEKHPPGS